MENVIPKDLRQHTGTFWTDWDGSWSDASAATPVHPSPPQQVCVCVCMCVCVRVSIQDQSVAMKLRLSLSRTHMHERPFPAEERGRQGQNRTCLNKCVWREHARMRARVRPGVPGAGSVAGPACTAAAPSTHFLFLLSKSWTNSGTSSCSCSAGSLHRKRKRRSRKEEPLFSGHST